MPGRGKVRPEKIKAVEDLSFKIEKYPVVGILNMNKLPAKALQNIRKELKDRAEIKVTKKNILVRSLDRVKEKKDLEKHMVIQSALLLTEMDPFKLYKFLNKNKTPAPAKPGDIAISEIKIEAGPTSLMPGPAISTLAKAKIPAKVEGGKISIIKDKLVAIPGDVISEDLAGVLQMLKIEPMEIGLDLVAVYEDGTIYTKDVLSVDEEQVLNDMVIAYNCAINLSVETGFATKESIEVMISKAFREAKSLSLEAGVVSKEIIGDLLAKALNEMKALESEVGDLKVEKKEPKSIEKAGENKEEKTDNKEGE